MLALAVFPCLAVSLEGAVTEAAHSDDAVPRDVCERTRMLSLPWSFPMVVCWAEVLGYLQ